MPVVFESRWQLSLSFYNGCGLNRSVRTLARAMQKQLDSSTCAGLKHILICAGTQECLWPLRAERRVENHCHILSVMLSDLRNAFRQLLSARRQSPRRSDGLEDGPLIVSVRMVHSRAMASRRDRRDSRAGR